MEPNIAGDVQKAPIFYFLLGIGVSHSTSPPFLITGHELIFLMLFEYGRRRLKMLNNEEDCSERNSCPISVALLQRLVSHNLFTYTMIEYHC